MTTPDAIIEPPPGSWLRAALDDRLRAIRRLLPANHTNTTVITTLTEGSAGLGRHVEDRTCDRCRRYIPEGEDLVVGIYGDTIRPGRRGQAVKVGIVFALCPSCREADVPAAQVGAA